MMMLLLIIRKDFQKNKVPKKRAANAKINQKILHQKILHKKIQNNTRYFIFLYNTYLIRVQAYVLEDTMSYYYSTYILLDCLLY